MGNGSSGGTSTCEQETEEADEEVAWEAVGKHLRDDEGCGKLAWVAMATPRILSSLARGCLRVVDKNTSTGVWEA